MQEEKKYLIEWVQRFLNNRNMIFRTIESIERHGVYDLLVKQKAKQQFVLAEPVLTKGALNMLDAEKNILLACFNTEENFRFMIENWKQLAACQNLTMYFVNPESEPDKKWIIAPYVHQKICDNASLKTGLRAMFETVMPLTAEKIKSLIKQKE